jgi:tetratricopeptide (TPR) repeat protein
MRNALRICILLVGSWPALGCLQTSGDKSVQDRQPTIKPDSAKNQNLTPSDIAQPAWLEQAGQARQQDHQNVLASFHGTEAARNAAPSRKQAQFYERAADLDRAIDEYQRLAALSPGDADLLTKIGDLYSRQGRWGAAEKAYGDALQRQPRHAAARSGLAFTLAQQGEYEKSLTEYADALSSKAEAYCAVAFVMNLRGKQQDAVRAYEEALRLEPALERARTALARIQQNPSAVAPASTQSANPIGGGMLPPGPTSRQALVELENTPLPSGDGINRLIQPRPTLPPAPDVDLSSAR